MLRQRGNGHLMIQTHGAYLPNVIYQSKPQISVDHLLLIMVKTVKMTGLELGQMQLSADHKQST